jgi:hypothetical protein
MQCYYGTHSGAPLFAVFVRRAKSFGRRKKKKKVETTKTEVGRSNNNRKGETIVPPLISPSVAVRVCVLFFNFTFSFLLAVHARAGARTVVLLEPYVPFFRLAAVCVLY